ncbi:MAG: twin-arginine translocase TatA/TatE family subunit [Dehalococcoidia bacterium]
MTRLFDNPLHLIVLLVVVLIIFGAGKLPSVGNALGTSIKEFKKATQEGEGHDPTHLDSNVCAQCKATNAVAAQFCSNCGATLLPQVVAAPPSEVFCASCGTKNGTEARFCAKCGNGLAVKAG